MTTTDVLSDQPGDLRAQLARAHERLSSYEKFDRQIAENVRRSGELMLEMLAMREVMTASTEGSNQRERERIAAGLAELESGLQLVSTQIDTFAGQVRTLRQSLGAEPQPAAPGQLTHAPAPDVLTDGAWNAPQVIDVIVHEVTRATIALSLQRHLGSLATVVGVEAREFAEGVLRMQVTARQPLTTGDLSGWTESGAFTVLQIQSNIVELTLDGSA